MNLYTAIITLIVVMDPLGNVPLFLSILNKVDPKRRTAIIIRETVFAYFVLLLFLFCGKHILAGLHITEPALGIAGGIILFIISLKMIFPPHEETHERYIGEPFIVPLAIPLTAGPSTIATVLLLTTQDPTLLFNWFIAITVATLVFLLTMLGANPLRKILGEKGLTAVERLMGMLLTTVSIQMFLDGIQHYFKLG